MPRAPYSSRLFQAADIGSSEDLTVPAGVTWVIRDIAVYDRTASATDRFYLLGPAGQLVYAVLGGADVNAAYSHWTGRVVMLEGETLIVDPAIGQWDVTISGYSLIN